MRWQGLSKGKTPKDFNKQQLERGTKVEMEHTNDKRVAKRIAMDHLTEDKNYYVKLKKIHNEAEKETWNKPIVVGNKEIEKKKVLDYYKKLWKKDKTFRDTLKKEGIFVRASYGKKGVIKRKGIKIKGINDLEKMIHEHAVEFILPVKKTGFNSFVDIDMPKKHIPKRRQIARSIIDKLKKRKIQINLVTDSPRGVHIFSKTDKKQVNTALKEIVEGDERMRVGKTSKTKIVLDPSESAVAIPNSLSIKGKPYKKW
jgi:hypothetical protein